MASYGHLSGAFRIQLLRPSRRALSPTKELSAKEKASLLKQTSAFRKLVVDYWRGPLFDGLPVVVPPSRRDLHVREEERVNRLVDYYYGLQHAQRTLYRQEEATKLQCVEAALEAMPKPLQQAALTPRDRLMPPFARPPTATPPIRGYRYAQGMLNPSPPPTPDDYKEPDELVYQTLEKAGFSSYEIRFGYETQDRKTLFEHGIMN
eukprot:TRINITY_DN23463_c0_g1_i1.p2 TRINITY_DN23463_c0_g1~~TRINITY_DN23463_c0_g1_i1.p2  ORF type:complete len:206 (-),score=19.09 TRINITY_DN23463_c0_g1_i1:82-699(-)